MHAMQLVVAAVVGMQQPGVPLPPVLVRPPVAAHLAAFNWAASALSKNDDLAQARSLLVAQQRRYPTAATRRGGAALFARIQTALAKQGEEEARRWLSQNAHPRSESDPTRAKGCASE